MRRAIKADPERHILESWSENASPWIKAISQAEIPSRLAVTNQAIVQAVLGTGAYQVLDVGCGEGWLSRELALKGCEVTGIDVIPELIEQAKLTSDSSQCRFHVCAYENINEGSLMGPFDAAVCNFSLLGDESVRCLLINIKAQLAENSHLLIQTLHPDNFEGSDGGWQEGNWQGFSTRFTNPAPWFFRTSDQWQSLLKELGYTNVKLMATKSSSTSKPTSLLITAELT